MPAAFAAFGTGAAATRSAFLAVDLDLVESLGVFVQPNGQVLDDRVQHAQPAFDFANNGAAGFDGEQHIGAFSKLLYEVGKSPLPHLLDLADLAATRSDHTLNLAVDLVDVFLER